MKGAGQNPRLFHWWIHLRNNHRVTKLGSKNASVPYRHYILKTIFVNIEEDRSIEAGCFATHAAILLLQTGLCLYWWALPMHNRLHCGSQPCFGFLWQKIFYALGSKIFMFEIVLLSDGTCSINSLFIIKGTNWSPTLRVRILSTVVLASKITNP